jgi:hypothetical protein
LKDYSDFPFFCQLHERHCFCFPVSIVSVKRSGTSLIAAPCLIAALLKVVHLAYRNDFNIFLNILLEFALVLISFYSAGSL